MARGLIIGEASIRDGGNAFKPILRFSGARVHAPVFSEPYPTPVSLYSGEPRHWRHRQLTYAHAKVGEWYAGIQAEWRMAGNRVVLQLNIAPGADPHAIQLAEGDRGVSTCTGIAVTTECRAFQMNARGEREALPFEFDTSRPNQPSFLTFPRPPAADSRVTVEFQFFLPTVDVVDARFASDGSLALLHNQGFVTFDRDGKPLYETRLSGLTPNRVLLTRGNEAVVWGVAGVTGRGSPNWPFLPEQRQWFIAKFDAGGQVISGLYGGGAMAAAVAPNGDIFVGKSTSERDGYSTLGRWIPGRFMLDSEIQIAGEVQHLTTDTTGNVFGLLAPRSVSAGSALTTRDTLNPRYEGQHQLYAVKLRADLTETVWATYLPMLPQAEGLTSLRASGMAVEANGEMLVAASARYPQRVGGTWDGIANVLHRLAADASHYVYGESLTTGPDSRLFPHTDGSVWVHGRTAQRNLPTSAFAQLRGACPDAFGSYVSSRSRTGGFLSGSYLTNERPLAVSPDGRLYVLRINSQQEDSLEPLALDTRGNTPSIACGATRVAAGGLVTVLGQGLGPPETQTATAKDGQWPAELAGTRATLDGRPAGLVAVQHGFTVLHVPASLSVSRLKLIVESSVGRAEGEAFVEASLATLFTTDGNGFGPVAAVHADGTLNSPMNRAKPNSIVSLFATGLNAQEWRVEFSPFGEARSVYRGPAPGLPGVTQFNVEVPANARGQAAVGLTTRPIGQGINISFPRTTIEIEN